MKVIVTVALVFIIPTEVRKQRLKRVKLSIVIKLINITAHILSLFCQISKLSDVFCNYSLSILITH